MLRVLLPVFFVTFFLAPIHASAVFPGTNGKIAFTSQRDGNTETYRSMQGAKKAATALKKIVKNAMIVDKTKKTK